MHSIVCKPKSLPFEKIGSAARRAIAINPANASEQGASPGYVAAVAPGRQGQNMVPVRRRAHRRRSVAIKMANFRDGVRGS